jgi:hypothetical protein
MVHACKSHSYRRRDGHNSIRNVQARLLEMLGINSTLPTFFFLPIKFLDIMYQILRLAPSLTVLEFSSVGDTPRLVIKSHRTARRHIQIVTSRDALPQHAHTIRPIIFAHAIIQFVKTHTVLQGAVLNQLLLGYLLVVAYEATGEAQVDLRIGIYGGGAEKDDVTQTFRLAVRALNAVVFFGGSEEYVNMCTARGMGAVRARLQMVPAGSQYLLSDEG